MVNARLNKPEFDCLTLDSTYECGCGDESGTPTSSDEVLQPTGRVSAEGEEVEDDFTVSPRPSFKLVEVPYDGVEQPDVSVER
jgi:hypothetical protein